MVELGSVFVIVIEIGIVMRRRRRKRERRRMGRRRRKGRKGRKGRRSRKSKRRLRRRRAWACTLPYARGSARSRVLPRSGRRVAGQILRGLVAYYSFQDVSRLTARDM